MELGSKTIKNAIHPMQGIIAEDTRMDWFGWADRQTDTHARTPNGYLLIKSINRNRDRAIKF